MADPTKFHWAPRVSRRDIQRLYESDARGLRDDELLEELHYAVYVRVLDMFEVREAQQTGRAKCRSCHAPLPQPFRLGGRFKQDALGCPHCGWETTCGEFFDSYSGKSLLPGSVTDLFEQYLARWASAHTPTDKMLLLDWLIHQFHVHQGVAGKPVGVNVIEGSTAQVRALIETLASGPSATPGRSSAAEWRTAYEDPVRLFKQSHSHSEVQRIAGELGIRGRSQMSEDQLIPEILRLAPELAVTPEKDRRINPTAEEA